MNCFFSHDNAIVETTQIGARTRIWAFTHILSGATIGEDCNICDHVFIENNVFIGDRVTIKSGVQLWEGIIIEENVFIGPNATFTNDPFPRSKQYLELYPKTIVRKGASIGANSTILPGITIGQYSMIGAGAVVTKNVPPYAIVVGNPARIKGYTQKKRQSATRINPVEITKGEEDLGIGGTKLYNLHKIEDLRGGLTFAEINEKLPFIPKRYFLVFDVPGKEVRGEHAHRKCQQYLSCIKGHCFVVVDDGKNRAEILLDRPNLGLFIPPMVWATQYNYSPDAMLLVFASDIYDAEDYIRDYDTFLQEVL